MDAPQPSAVTCPSPQERRRLNRLLFCGSGWRVMKEVARKWSDHEILRESAVLAFYSIFSIAPLLVIVLSAASSIYGPAAVRGHLDDQLRSLMGPQAAATVQELLAGAMHPRKSIIATIAGIVMMIFGATSLFAELQHSLNIIWGKSDEPPRGGIYGWFRTRLLSFGMVLVILLLLLISLVFSTVFAFLSRHLAIWTDIPLPVLGLMGVCISLVCEIILFAFLFRYLPDVRVHWRYVWWGAAATAGMFEIGKFALAWYLGTEAVSSSYGAAGSIVLLLLWVYYTAVIILTGAEVTRVRAQFC